MVLANIWIDIFGIAMLLTVAVCNMLETRRLQKVQYVYAFMLIATILLLASDALAWHLEDVGKEDIKILICNLIVWVMGYVMCLLFNVYLYYSIEPQKRHRIFFPVVYAVIGICIMLCFVSLFNGMFFTVIDGRYVRGPYFIPSQAIAEVVLLFDVVLILRRRRALGKRVGVLAFYCLAPLIAIVVQTFVYGLSISYIMSAYALLLIYNKTFIERGNELRKKERELAEQHEEVLLFQIQPHFLYNALNTIRYLCKHDPVLAEEAIIGFSKYLRGNMDSLSQTKPIPFKNDLEHLGYYLAIEKLRFSNINVQYDIRAKEFPIPVLTLQPIVENAIKHGLTQKPEGGTVKIFSDELENEYIVQVSDDGVGFDTTVPRPPDKRSHIGVNNTRSRIETMCGGTFDIDSTPGVGTTVTIRIPKQGGEQNASL